MTASQPKITIITVTRNDVEALRKTISSVVGQDYPDVEFIIIDGGSGDGTVEVIKAHAARIAYWISEPDRGIYDAMNKGLAMATGSWVNFMNAGDTFHGMDTLSGLMAFDLDGYGVVYGDSFARYPRSTVFKPAGAPAEMIKGMVFCHQAAFVRRELIGAGGFDLSFPIGADFKMLFGLYASGCQFKKLSFTIAIFDASGISNQKMLQSAQEHFAIVKGYKELNLSERLYHYCFICRVRMISLAYRILPAGVVRWVRGRGVGGRVTR